MGDAAHLMTPFAGVGVNVAMEDALELGRAIIAAKNMAQITPLEAHFDLLSKSIQAYEECMFKRAKGYAEETWMYYNLFFNKRGGVAMCEQFAEAKKQEKKAAEEKAAAEKEAALASSAPSTPPPAYA
jgi:2-polyprenyl-6-methoxyphenol hydroxylase-like FAD-dependent oxidoreductase